MWVPVCPTLQFLAEKSNVFYGIFLFSLVIVSLFRNYIDKFAIQILLGFCVFTTIWQLARSRVHAWYGLFALLSFGYYLVEIDIDTVDKTLCPSMCHTCSVQELIICSLSIVAILEIAVLVVT